MVIMTPSRKIDTRKSGPLAGLTAGWISEEILQAGYSEIIKTHSKRCKMRLAHRRVYSPMVYMISPTFNHLIKITNMEFL